MPLLERPCSVLSHTSNVAELHQWLDALRAAARQGLGQGHRISL